MTEDNRAEQVREVPEGFEGPFTDGWRCLTCGTLIRGPYPFLVLHRGWHLEDGHI